ncbi:MAG: glycosyltransferase family 4 protein [Bacteroidales bacterium]|nr:glycosyltransferase family 4 protein [Bacteroidales bacterium]
MVIGYDAKRAYKNNSGLGNYSRMVIGGVAKEVDCVLFTPSLKGRHEHYFDGMPKVATRVPQGLWSLAPSLWRTLAVGRNAEREHVQLYHGLSHELPYFLPKGMKCVVTMHDLIVRRYPDFFKPVDRLIHRWKQRHACRVADVVVAISEQTKRDLVEMMHVPEEKIKVVYQSCDPIFWCRGVVESWSRGEGSGYSLPSRYIICVGTVEERKNQATAVRALAQLPEEVALVIVGRPRGSYPQEVRRVAKELGMEQRVVFLEDAKFADFPMLYHNAVASVYMSVFEGFGIPVLESMCCDTPVVTSNVSSMPEAGGDAALYADPMDADAVAAHLRRLLEDPAFRQGQIEKGRTQRLRFAPEKVSQDMLALYRSLLDD